MKIHGVKLNKKNFWIPFLVSSILSFLILFFALAILVSGGDNILLAFILLLPGSIPMLGFVLIPPFFIIKRLLSQNPKKLFYFELPILLIIYFAIIVVNDFIGLMFGGPTGMTISNILSFLIPQIIFTALWIFLLTISLYFYYKRNNFFPKLK